MLEENQAGVRGGEGPLRESLGVSRPWFFAVGAVVGALFVWHVLSLAFLQDDAYISFRYVQNALDGHGLVWNVGERVEGYTNFLWVVLLLVFGRLGLPLEGTAQVLGVIAGLGTLAVTMLIARQTVRSAGGQRDRVWVWGAPALVAAAGCFAYWTISGLETPLFAFLLTLSVWLFLRRSPLVGVALAAATLTRPEGGLVAAVLIGWELLFGAGWRRALATALVAAAFLAPFAAFKWFYYGSLLPNSFYAKTGIGLTYLESGLEYSWSYLRLYALWGVLLLPGLWVLRSLGKRERVVIVLWWVYALYIVLVGGDVLYALRFFVPVAPLFALGLVWGIEAIARSIAPAIRPSTRALTVGVAVLLVAGYTYAYPGSEIAGVRYREVGLTNKMTAVARSLLANDTRRFSIAASTIGKLGWELLRHPVYDMLGLTDSTVARHPETLPGMRTTWKERKFNASHILGRDTDYILFSTGNKPSAPAERALFLHSAFRRHYYQSTYPSADIEQILIVWRRKPGRPPTDDVSDDLMIPDSINAGLNHMLQGRHDAAIAALGHVQHHGPGDFALPYAEMANSALQMGDPATARAYSDSALSIDSVAVTAWITRLRIASVMSDTAAARQAISWIRGICPWMVP